MRLKFAGINIVFVNGRLGFGLGFRTAELIAGDIDVVGRDDECIVCDALELTVDGVCNAGKEVDKTASV